jgi:HK97 family phage major capsid protein
MEEDLSELEKAISETTSLAKLAVQRQLRQNERLDAIETVMGRAPLMGMSAFEATEESKAFGQFIRKGEKGMGPDEFKTLLVSDDPSAGFMCSNEMAAQILHAETLGSPIRGICKVYQTDKNALEILKKDGSGTVRYQGGEVAEMTETTGFSLAKLTFTPRTRYYTIKESVMHLADSDFPVEQELALEWGERFGAFESNEMVNGTEGLLANIAVGANEYAHIHNVSTTVLDPDKLIDMTYSVKTPYLAGARWLMSRATLGTVRKLKDVVTGAYLWQNSLVGGNDNQLCGYPITLCDDMPAATSGLYPIAFGNFQKAFCVVDRTPLFAVQRLAERWAEFGIVGYIATARSTHGPLIGEALTFLLMSA